MKTSRPTESLRTRPQPAPPAEADHWLKLFELYEATKWSSLVRRSYWLSRFWAWASRIERQPRLRIPVPRFFITRDS